MIFKLNPLNKTYGQRRYTSFAKNKTWFVAASIIISHNNNYITAITPYFIVARSWRNGTALTKHRPETRKVLVFNVNLSLTLLTTHL